MQNTYGNKMITRIMSIDYLYMFARYRKWRFQSFRSLIAGKKYFKENLLCTRSLRWNLPEEPCVSM